MWNNPIIWSLHTQNWRFKSSQCLERLGMGHSDFFLCVWVCVWANGCVKQALWGVFQQWVVEEQLLPSSCLHRNTLVAVWWSTVLLYWCNIATCFVVWCASLEFFSSLWCSICDINRPRLCITHFLPYGDVNVPKNWQRRIQWVLNCQSIVLCLQTKCMLSRWSLWNSSVAP